MSGHHPISDLLVTQKVNPERLANTADIVEISLELQKLITKGEDHDKIKILSDRLAEMIFETDQITRDGVVSVLSQMVNTKLGIAKPQAVED